MTPSNFELRTSLRRAAAATVAAEAARRARPARTLAVQRVIVQARLPVVGRADALFVARRAGAIRQNAIRVVQLRPRARRGPAGYRRWANTGTRVRVRILLGHVHHLANVPGVNVQVDLP